MSVNIHFLGHSTFIFSSGEHHLLVDPFIEGNPKCPLDLKAVQEMNISAVLVSHAHGDHWGNALDFGKAGVPIIATYEIANYAEQHGAKNTVGMNIGGTYKADWGSVYITPAWHSSSFPDATYGGMPTGLVIELGGKRIYFAGDTAMFSDMRLIGDRGLDVAMLPVGDHYTMGPEEAARSLELLRPKLAIPMHFGTFPALSGDPEDFKVAGQMRDVEVKVMQPGEQLTL